MDTREFLKDALATHTDRASPVHFAGRRLELDLVLSRATRAQPGTAGGTIVLQGAPGAGKTALLNEIAVRFKAQGTRNRAIFLASPWTHSGEGAVLERLAHAAFDIDPGAFDRVETRSETATAGASVARAGRTRSIATSPPDLADWIRFENRYASQADEASRTLILADESQTFEDDAGALLKALHTQNRFPFLLVCGGLSDTQERLASLGLSRLDSDSVLRLGTMSAAEAREAAFESLVWTLAGGAAPPIRHTGAEVERWADEVAHASMGWPQHLASYLKGVWHALVQSRALELSEDICAPLCGMESRFATVTMPSRLTIAGTDPRIVLAVYGALAETGANAYERAFDAVESTVADLPRAAQAAYRQTHPEGAAACLQRLLKAGLIEAPPDGLSLLATIPSMDKYLRRVVLEAGNS